MRIQQTLVIALALLAWNSPSYADKVDDVKKAINSAAGCEKKAIADSDALRYVKDLFIKCEKGSDVDIEGCKVKCQRN